MMKQGDQAAGAAIEPADSAGGEALCRIATLLDALHCGAFLVDRSGRIVHANCRLCTMMDRPCGDLVGRTLFELYPAGPGREAVEHGLAHFDESREQEFFLPRADGSELPVILSGRRLAGDPPLSDHRIVTVIDISPQKRAERERQARYREVAELSDTVLEQALELKRYAGRLEERVRERTAELHEANMEAILMLAVASEAKDVDTGAHVRRIERYTRLLALELGLDATAATHLGHSAILHDVGKIHVPDEILRKPGPLNEAEWVVMREHTVAGEHILSRAPFFSAARMIARSHHENWDGSGYPDGRAEEAIPLAARIVRVADVFDALTSERSYKRAWSESEAIALVEEARGRLFDPKVVAAFLHLHRTGRFVARDSDEATS